MKRETDMIVYEKNGQNMEKRVPAPPKMLALLLTEEECYLVIKSLDLYSRIWIGQYDRIDDLSIYDTGGRWNKESIRYTLFQRMRNLLIPSLAGMGDYTSCSLGIWSDKTDIKAINAYDIQQRLRYEISWFKKPEGDITVNYDTPWIRGEIGDYSVFCLRDDVGISAYLYLSKEHLTAIQVSLEVYRLLLERDMRGAFQYFTSNEEALSIAAELTIVYSKCGFLSFFSDEDFGKRIYYDLKDKLTKLLRKITKTMEEKAYVNTIRVNIPPANPFLNSEEIMGILDIPFKHFRKTRRKAPPPGVLKLPGAGFLTQMTGREHSTTDYLLVWYDEGSKTEFYYAGEDYVIKHSGKLDLPEDIRKYIRNKCYATGGEDHGK